MEGLGGKGGQEREGGADIYSYFSKHLSHQLIQSKGNVQSFIHPHKNKMQRNTIFKAPAIFNISQRVVELRPFERGHRTGGVSRYQRYIISADTK